MIAGRRKSYNRTLLVYIIGRDMSRESQLPTLNRFYLQLHHQKKNMKAFSCLAAVLCSLSTTAFATKSFLASNLYYAAGLKDSQSTTLLDGLNNASVKVLRVWLDGESSTVYHIV